MERHEIRRTPTNAVKRMLLSLFPYNSIGNKPVYLNTTAIARGRDHFRKAPSKKRLFHMRRRKPPKRIPAAELTPSNTVSDPPESDPKGKQQHRRAQKWKEHKQTHQQLSESPQRGPRRQKRMLLDLLPYNNNGLKAPELGTKEESPQQPMPQQPLKKSRQCVPRRPKRMLSNLLPYNSEGLKPSHVGAQKESQQKATPHQPTPKSGKGKRRKRMLSDLLPYNNEGLDPFGVGGQQESIQRPSPVQPPLKTRKRARYNKKKTSSDVVLPVKIECRGESQKSSDHQPIQKSRQKVYRREKRMLLDLLPYNEVGLKSSDLGEGGRSRRRKQQVQPQEERNAAPQSKSSKPSQPRNRPKRMLADLFPYNAVGLEPSDIDTGGKRKRKRAHRLGYY